MDGMQVKRSLASLINKYGLTSQKIALKIRQGILLFIFHTHTGFLLHIYKWPVKKTTGCGFDSRGGNDILYVIFLFLSKFSGK